MEKIPRGPKLIKPTFIFNYLKSNRNPKKIILRRIFFNQSELQEQITPQNHRNY